MPRSIGVFCQQDWPIQPYPVDYHSKKGDLMRVEFNFVDNLGNLNTAIKEWVGLISYRRSIFALSFFRKLLAFDLSYQDTGKAKPGVGMNKGSDSALLPALARRQICHGDH